MKKNALTIGVFCGSKSGQTKDYALQAENLGRAIGKNGFKMVFGGGGTGLMGICSQSALKNGAHVIGVMPLCLQDKEAPASNLSELYVVTSMPLRKKSLMELADMIIVMPGGIGTMDETFEVMTNNTLGLFNKPIGFLDVNDYFKSLFDFMKHAVDQGFISQQDLDRMHLDNDPEQLIRTLSAELGNR